MEGVESKSKGLVGELTADVQEVTRNKLLLAMLVAVILLVLVVFFGMLGFLVKKSEMFQGSSSVPDNQNSWKSRAPGLGDRLRGQEMSGTNQGGPTNNSLTSTHFNEHGLPETLVGGGEAPNFWEVSSALGDYQRKSSRTAEGGGYWSPDLNAWLSEDEVASLPAQQRDNVQFYGSAAAMKAVAAMQPPAKEGFASDNVNQYLAEEMKSKWNKPSTWFTPEDRMLSENFSADLMKPETRSENFGELPGLTSRMGVY
jgi:hypothetical protein